MQKVLFFLLFYLKKKEQNNRMGKKPKYLTKSINFGEIDCKARMFVEAYLQKVKIDFEKEKIQGTNNKRTKKTLHPQKALSDWIRKCVIKVCSCDPEFKFIQSMIKIQEHKLLKKKAGGFHQRMADVGNELKDMGINPDKEYIALKKKR